MVLAENLLFRVNRSKRTVSLRRGPALKAFERLVRRDPIYGPRRVQNVWWLWIDGEPQPPPVIHQLICAERPYNEVPVGGLTEEVLRIQEDARLLFDAPAFVADYERIRSSRESMLFEMTDQSGQIPTMAMPWKQLSAPQRAARKRALKMRAFLWEFRSVYEQAVRLKRVVTVRSAFHKVLNRRFQAAHFFPMAVSDRRDQPLPRALAAEFGGIWNMTDASRSRWFSAPGPDGQSLPMVAVDVSSSQMQLTAALLGLPEPELKHVRAQRVWDARHGLLRDGYKGANDPRLIEATKNLLLRLGYGSAVHNIVREQGWKPETYGPGWVSAKALEAFLDDLPGTREMLQFLRACQWIGRHADRYAGLELVDSLDQTPFQWNPVQRADVRLALDRWDVTLIKPGRYMGGRCPTCGSSRNVRRGNRRTCQSSECRHTWTVAFIPNDANAAGDYPIDPVKLHNMAAPCLIHALDALFAAHVVLELRRRGVVNIVSIHDGWYVPKTPAAVQTLQAAIKAAGEPWLRGLEDVYKSLLHYLKPSPDPEWRDLMQGAYDQWRGRMALRDWPVFTAAVS